MFDRHNLLLVHFCWNFEFYFSRILIWMLLLWNIISSKKWNFKVIDRFRVWISSLHFTNCEGILSFCKALSQRNNKNAKLSVLFLASKFHLTTVIFNQDNVLQKHFTSWHNLILQPPRQANFWAVYLTSFMFYVLNFFNFSLTLFCAVK